MLLALIASFIFGKTVAGQAAIKLMAAADAFIIWMLTTGFQTAVIGGAWFSTKVMQVILFVDELLDQIGYSYPDFFALICIIFIVYQLYSAGKIVMRSSLDFYARLYDLLYSSEGEVFYIKPSESTETELEAANANNSTFVSEPEEKPKGVFQVFIKTGERDYCLVGHGFVNAGRLYTAYHVAKQDLPLYVRAPMSQKLYPTSIDLTECATALDLCALQGKNLAAVMGLQSLEIAYPSKAAVKVYTHTSNGTVKYSVQHVRPASLEETPNYLYLATNSDTRPGDSGLPVLQGGRVVAIHIGSSNQIKKNIHAILITKVASEIKRRAAQKKAVFEDLDMASCYVSESINIEYDDDRAVQLAKAIAELEQQERITRMLGQHQDDQGFRRSMRNPNFKSASWADMEEEVNTSQESADNELGNCSPPAERAESVLLQENETLRKALNDLLVQVKRLTKSRGPTTESSTQMNTQPVSQPVPTATNESMQAKGSELSIAAQDSIKKRKRSSKKSKPTSPVSDTTSSPSTCLQEA